MGAKVRNMHTTESLNWLRSASSSRSTSFGFRWRYHSIHRKHRIDRIPEGGLWTHGWNRASARPPADSAQPRPTRLQQQIDQLVALDVEFAHFKTPGSPRIEHLPAEVCLVDARGTTLLHTLCNPLNPSQAEGWEFVGGVPPGEWRDAPALPLVREDLKARARGKILVGHNLPKDLASLKISHPRTLQRDTMRYRQLQGGRKQGQRLAALSEEKLGRRIQEGERHDPREDALAALELYLQHVHLDPSTMDYEDLVEHHLAEILGGGAAGGDMHGQKATLE